MTDNDIDEIDQNLYSEQRLNQATVLIEDAFNFRSIDHKLQPNHILQVYRFYWSRLCQTFLSMIVACQLLLIFIQYPSSISRTSDLKQEIDRWTLPCSAQIIIEFCCLLIFYADASIRVYLLGWNHARRKPWIIAYFIVNSISFFDLISSSIIGCQTKTINIRLLLRPFYMAAISQEMKKIFNSVRKSFVQILSVTILLGIHVYFFSVIGMILFPPARTRPLANERPNEGTKYFPDFLDALLNLIVLLTTANNPDVTLPAYSKHRLYIIYFAIFLTIGLYCLMTLFTVIKMNTFKEYFTTSMQNSLFRRRLATRACFDILVDYRTLPLNIANSFTDELNTALLGDQRSRFTIPYPIMNSIISRSNIPKSYRDELRNALQRNEQQSIGLNWEKFSIIMLTLDADLIKRSIVQHQYQGPWRFLQKIGSSKYFIWLGNGVALMNYIVLVVEAGLRYNVDFFNIDIILSTLLFSFALYYVFETILKLWSLRFEIFFVKIFNTFDGLLGIVLFILHIVHWSIYGQLSITNSELLNDARGTATSVWAITRIVNLFVIFRVIRSMPHFTNYGIIMGTISDGMRNLKAFVGILICLFYIYAVLGMWLFRGIIKSPTAAEIANATCGSYQQSNYWANNFDDFFSTIVILYDVMLVNNWAIFLAALREFSSRASQLYLVSWWFISNVYILALVLGFIVELFSLNVARYEQRRNSQNETSSINIYFVKTLFHLFKGSLKEPTDEEIEKELVKIKRLHINETN